MDNYGRIILKTLDSMKEALILAVKFLSMRIKRTSTLGRKKYGSQRISSEKVNKCLLAQRQYGLKDEKMFIKEREGKQSEKTG